MVIDVFDLDLLAPEPGCSADIPAGWYPAEILEVVELSSDELEWYFTILGGSAKGYRGLGYTANDFSTHSEGYAWMVSLLGHDSEEVDLGELSGQGCIVELDDHDCSASHINVTVVGLPSALKHLERARSTEKQLETMRMLSPRELVEATRRATLELEALQKRR